MANIPFLLLNYCNFIARLPRLRPDVSFQNTLSIATLPVSCPFTFMFLATSSSPSTSLSSSTSTLNYLYRFNKLRHLFHLCCSIYSVICFRNFLLNKIHSNLSVYVGFIVSILFRWSLGFNL